MNKYLQLSKYIDFGYRKLAPLLLKFDHLFCNTNQPPQPVFLIGVPRSGTTLVYQLMVRHFDFLYVSNFVERFYATPNLSFKLDQRLRGGQPFSYTSDFGKTDADGLKAPNQGVNFFYQFFGLDNIKHHQTLDELDKSKLSMLEKTVAGLTSRYNKSMVFKELSLGQKLPVLKSLFPQAKYILIERELVYAAQSIHQAMTKNNHPQNSMWGGQFEGFEQFLSLEKNKLVANQVVGIRRGIERGLEMIDSGQVLRINYKDVCLDTESTLNKIAEFVQMPIETAVDGQRVDYSEKITIDEQDFEQIRTELLRISN